VELIAIRDAGTTKQQVLEELPSWTLNEILCPYGHRLAFPSPRESY